MTFKQLNYNSTTDYNLTFKRLTSLEGVPNEIKGLFDCSNNKLTSLKYSPKNVKGGFFCNYNKLSSLKYCPKTIKGLFDCSNNKLTTLEYSPKNVNVFFCDNNELTSLKDAPKNIVKSLHCKGNKNLKNIKEQIINYQIKAEKYYTDEGVFTFEDIKEEFKKITNQKIKNTDFGFSII